MATIRHKPGHIAASEKSPGKETLTVAGMADAGTVTRAVIDGGVGDSPGSMHMELRRQFYGFGVNEAGLIRIPCPVGTVKIIKLWLLAKLFHARY
jgi:hypothetical protein